jgi:hypothetical protein
MGFYN